MIYISYNLSTFKNLAKQLKRIYREVKPNILTMDCLDIVAKAHNAKGWNDLYKTHQMAISEAKEGKEVPYRLMAFFFIEDLSFKARTKLLDDVLGKMSDMGVPLDVINEYGAKIFSIYAPTSSDFFMKTFGEGIDRSLMKYTSFDDMHGNLFLVSESKKKHTLFLEKEVIPECLNRGGLLVLSSEQYHECQHLLSGDNIQTIHLENDKPMTPLSWSQNASVEQVEEYYNAFFNVGYRSIWEGMTASFLSSLFHLWKGVGKDMLPINTVLDFSPMTVDLMLKMYAEMHAGKIPKEGYSGFCIGELTNVDMSNPGWAKKIKGAANECWNYLIMGRQELHIKMVANSGRRNAVHVDSLFDDLSKTTVIVCDNLTLNPSRFKDSNSDYWVNEDSLLGIIGFLSSTFKKRREERLLAGRVMPKYVVYTSPNSIAVKRVTSDLVISNGPNLKMVNSVLVEPPKNDDLLLNPKALKLDNIKTFGFDEYDYNILKNQADYVLNLDSIY